MKYYFVTDDKIKLIETGEFPIKKVRNILNFILFKIDNEFLVSKKKRLISSHYMMLWNLPKKDFNKYLVKLNKSKKKIEFIDGDPNYEYILKEYVQDKLNKHLNIIQELEADAIIKAENEDFACFPIDGKYYYIDAEIYTWLNSKGYKLFLAEDEKYMTDHYNAQIIVLKDKKGKVSGYISIGESFLDEYMIEDD